MPNLYSYCIPYDDGAAPNPYWGVCTLVICKPGIRSKAREGDWVVGTGSGNARRSRRDRNPRDLSGCVVYAMKVTETITMAEYEARTRQDESLQNKIPDPESADRRRWVGDSIYYDFSAGSAKQRPGVHGPKNRETDLRGKRALLSTHFYYFGDEAVPLPDDLRPIAQNQQGHRVPLNDPFVDRFVTWIEGLGLEPCTLIGEPLWKMEKDDLTDGYCATGRAEDTDEEECGGVC